MNSIGVNTTKLPLRDPSGKITGTFGISRDVTERRRSQDRLRTLSAAVEQSPVSIVVTDLQGRIEYANSKTAEVTGYTPEELRGQNPRILKSGDTPAEDYQNLWRTIQTGEWRGTFHNRRKNGELFWESAAIRPICDSSGAPTHYLAVKEDITARKLAEDKIAWLASFPEQNPNPVVEIEVPGGLVHYANPAAQAVFLDLHQQGLAHVWLDGFEQVVEALTRANRNELSRDIAVGNRCFTQTFHYLPEARRLRVYGLDITQRKRAAEALRRSETKFRTLYDSTSDAVMLLNDRSFINCNHAAMAMFSCATREEYCSKHPADMSPPKQPCGTDSLALANQHIATAMAKGSDRFEWVHKRLDTGETFPAEVLLNAMELDGKPVVQAVVRDITERKRAEEALRRSEDEMRSLFDDAPLPYHEIDRNGIVLRVNRVECEMLGVEASEMVGRPIWDFAVPEERDSCRGAATGLAGPASPNPYERRFRSRTGAEYVFQLHHRLILDPAGNVAGVRTAMVDLTETKQLDASLAKERQLLRTLMDQSPDHIYFKDTEGRFVLVNASMVRLVGCSHPSQLVGKSDYDFFTAEHANPAYADEQDLVRERVPLISKEEKETWQGGRESWVTTTKLPLRDPCDKIIGTCGISRDITERKQAENALRESELKYRTLVEHIPQRIIYKDRESVYVSCNELFAQDVGIAAADVAGKTDFDFSPPELAEKYRADDRRIMELGRTVELEEDYVSRGEHYTVRTTKTPVTGKQGEVIGILVVVTDITERKRAEEALHESERQLRLAQKLESIGQLAAGIAHEINTPIQYVGDNAKFLDQAFRDVTPFLSSHPRIIHALRGSAEPELAGELERIVQEADIDYLCGEAPKAIEELSKGVEQVARIVRAMKEFSHPGPLEKTPQDLNRAIESTVVVSKNEWKYVADLTTDFDPDLPPVPCVAGEFNQVMLNLIVNAAHAIADVVKGSGEKGVIHVSTRRNGAWAEIRVRDTGTGIPEAIRPKVFDPFFTTKEVGKGTGQGLSIAHSVIVKKHGGRLFFDTRCGAGTTFLIQLPLAQPETS